MAGVDKVWEALAGIPVVERALRALYRGADRTVLVVHRDRLDRATEMVGSRFPSVAVVPGGLERQDSVWNGLVELIGCDTVAVHDAARPFATPDLLARGLRLLADADGAVPVIPVVDTIKRIDASGHVLETVPRATLRAVQTPQLFRAASLHAAHERARSEGWKGTDDAAVLERAGMRVVTFPGETNNLKITTATDLEYARFLLEAAETG